LEAVNRLTDEGTPVLGLVSGAVPGFVLSSAAAASAAGLKNTGAVCKPDRLEIQYHWESSKQKPIAGRENPQNIMRVAIRQTLMSAGQPVKYLAPYASAVNALGELRLLPAVDDPLFPENLGKFRTESQKYSWIALSSIIMSLLPRTWSLVSGTLKTQQTARHPWMTGWKG